MPSMARLAAAALALRAPIKWIEDRHENFLSTQQERDSALGHGDRGRPARPASWACAEPSPTRPAPICRGGWCCPGSPPLRCRGPYVIPSFHLDVAVAFNHTRCRPRRCAAPDVPQAAVVMERLMDRVAHELKLDRAEVRRRNFIKPAQMAVQSRHHFSAMAVR